jgi:hypothetical protein
LVLTLIQTASFVSQFRRSRLRDDDLRALELMLVENPEAGRIMPRTGGVRKVRFAPPSRGQGKRGGMRVCCAWFPGHSTIGLFLVYPKNEKDTLTADDEAVCRLLVSRMQASLEKG